MNDHHAPSINSVIDTITACREATTDQDEYEALIEAQGVIEAYVFRQKRTIGLIERVLHRIARHGREMVAS